MIKTICTVALLFVCIGCADSILLTRPVLDEPNVLVGLVSQNDPENLAQVRHNHPKEWSEADLQAILTGLLIQRPGGIMDPIPQPRAIFTPDDIVHLAPALREAFKVAQPFDWIGFAVWGSAPTSQALEVTSGGMFLLDQRLHFILSNHQELVFSKTEGIKGIRSNPFRPLRDIKTGKLLFDPNRYMIDSRENWVTGGFNSPSSELILDLRGLLAPGPPSGPGEQKKLTTTNGARTENMSDPSTKDDVRELKKEISNLKEELSRLQRQIIQQADKRSRLTSPKSHLSPP